MRLFQQTGINQPICDRIWANRGYDCKLISVDRTREPYDLLKQIIIEGRYNGVKHKVFSNELRKLLDHGDKIDHPKKGSKDVTDGVCGSVWNTYNHYEQYFNAMSATEFVKSLEKYMVKNMNVYEKLAQQQHINRRLVFKKEEYGHIY